MKCFMGASLGILIAAISVGCRSAPAPSPSRVSVQIEGQGAFPAALAGRWKADRDGWEFVFDSEGRIVSAVLSLGRVAITPGHPVTLPTRSGGEGRFEPGDWTVHYAPETRQLTLKIAMDHVRVAMADAILEGRTTDTFSGTLSPADGTWQAQWTAFNQYTIQTPGRPAQALSTDKTYGETKALTFQKVVSP